jgi:hypothetical protein
MATGKIAGVPLGEKGFAIYRISYSNFLFRVAILGNWYRLADARRGDHLRGARFFLAYAGGNRRGCSSLSGGP